MEEDGLDFELSQLALDIAEAGESLNEMSVEVEGFDVFGDNVWVAG